MRRDGIERCTAISDPFPYIHDEIRKRFADLDLRDLYLARGDVHQLNGL